MIKMRRDETKCDSCYWSRQSSNEWFCLKGKRKKRAKNEYCDLYREIDKTIEESVSEGK